MNEILIPNYQKNDFLQSSAPFEWLYSFKDDKLKLKQMTNMLAEKAGAVGVRNFVKLFQAYLETVNSKNGTVTENTTDFEGQSMELNCGSWYCDEFGVTSTDKFGFEITACNHPIMPVQRLVNIDTGVEKLKLAYKKNKQWRYYIADKKTLASSNSILQLADFGIAVNSENSKYLVKYLTDIEHMNYDRIEELSSVGRLGWIDDYGFSPYVDNIVFDGDLSFKHYFESVQEKGNFKEWSKIVKEIRQGDIIARIMLSASFASVLVKPCNCLPFFVHLWGGTEAGKTVGLMLAASVWANPRLGDYIHTFNSTSVGHEMSAGFVNSLPLILDELQIVGDKKDFDRLIYMLSEGVGRSRGAKTGGLQKVTSWQNCILTNGEQPISNGSSAGGAMNRIIEIDCKDTKLFTDPVKVVDIVKKNYGHAGRLFVELLQTEENLNYAVDTQKDIYKSISTKDITEKQTMAASLILTADKLINEWLFLDNALLGFSDIEPYLSTKKQVSAHERALEFLQDSISVNLNKFMSDTKSSDDIKGELWGTMDDDYTYIIKSQFDKLMLDNGYNPAAFLSWARSKNIIEVDGNRTTKVKKILKQPCRCVWLKKIEAFEEIEAPDTSDLPF